MKRHGDDESIEIDPSLSHAVLHKRVERLAVPTFDWLSTPLEAIAEGLTHHSHTRPVRGEQPGRPGHRR